MSKNTTMRELLQHLPRVVSETAKYILPTKLYRTEQAEMRSPLSETEPSLNRIMHRTSKKMLGTDRWNTAQGSSPGKKQLCTVRAFCVRMVTLTYNISLVHQYVPYAIRQQHTEKLRLSYSGSKHTVKTHQKAKISFLVILYWRRSSRSGEPTTLDRYI